MGIYFLFAFLVAWLLWAGKSMDDDDKANAAKQQRQHIKDMQDQCNESINPKN